MFTVVLNLLTFFTLYFTFSVKYGYVLLTFLKNPSILGYCDNVIKNILNKYLRGRDYVTLT